MKTQKKLTIIAVTLFTLLITIFIASLSCLAVIQEVKTLDIQLTVADHLGFNTDTDKLYLGTIPRGNTGSRSVVIENKEYEKSIVRLKVFGELKNWVTVSENNFILKKGESKLVKVEVSVPEDVELKGYNSKMVIAFTRF